VSTVEPDALRAPHKQARGLGSAKSGVGHWWLQRITAIALVPLTLWFVWLAMTLVHADYATVLGSIAQPVHAFFLIVLVACAYWHGMLGLQVIIEDYVHARPLAVGLQIALRFGAALGALAGVLAVLAVWLTSTTYY
jgi:succinate dehydrogenase membrane anchor subunit